jgi:hypothetical protein
VWILFDRPVQPTRKEIQELETLAVPVSEPVAVPGQNNQTSSAKAVWNHVGSVYSIHRYAFVKQSIPDSISSEISGLSRQN